MTGTFKSNGLDGFICAVIIPVTLNVLVIGFVSLVNKFPIGFVPEVALFKPPASTALSIS